MSGAKNYWGDSTQDADLKVARYVDQVFLRLAQYHGEDKRNKALGIVDSVAQVKAVWAAEFCLMTPEMVALGAKKIRDQSFCPNLARFTQLCKPSAEEAYVEAQLGFNARARGEFGVWSCPAVYFSGVDFGLADLRDKDWTRAAARFSKIYERAILRQERGELDLIPVPVPPDLWLESKPAVSDGKKVAALIGRVYVAANSNPKHWADVPRSFTATREMLARAQAGSIASDVVKHNLEMGTIIREGDWFKPIGYVQGGKLVVCVH